MFKQTKAIKDKFWKRVDKTTENECWNWNAVRNVNGYGRFRTDQGMYYAHRVAYYICFGIDPAEDMVCHNCDNTSCVNPNHLFLGNQFDNMKDCVAKNRQYRGEKHHSAKLTQTDIIKIRDMHQNGSTNKELAQQFGVHNGNIANIINRKIWKDV